MDNNIIELTGEIDVFVSLWLKIKWRKEIGCWERLLTYITHTRTHAHELVPYTHAQGRLQTCSLPFLSSSNTREEKGNHQPSNQLPSLPLRCLSPVHLSSCLPSCLPSPPRDASEGDAGLSLGRILAGIASSSHAGNRSRVIVTLQRHLLFLRQVCGATRGVAAWEKEACLSYSFGLFLYVSLGLSVSK